MQTDAGTIFLDRPPQFRGSSKSIPRGIQPIDFCDVLVSEQVVETVGEYTARVISKYIPGHVHITEEFSELIGKVDERAWWVERTGALLLTVDILGERHLLQVPADMWETRQRSCH